MSNVELLRLEYILEFVLSNIDMSSVCSEMIEEGLTIVQEQLK